MKISAMCVCGFSLVMFSACLSQESPNPAVDSAENELSAHSPEMSGVMHGLSADDCVSFRITSQSYRGSEEAASGGTGIELECDTPEGVIHHQIFVPLLADELSEGDTFEESFAEIDSPSVVVSTLSAESEDWEGTQLSEVLVVVESVTESDVVLRWTATRDTEISDTIESPDDPGVWIVDPEITLDVGGAISIPRSE